MQSTEAGAGVQGKGHGKIRIKAQYYPFETLYSKPRKATMVSHLVLEAGQCKLGLSGSQVKRLRRALCW